MCVIISVIVDSCNTIFICFPLNREIFVYKCVEIGLFIVYIYHLVCVNNEVHKLRNLAHCIVISCLNHIVFLDAVILRLKLSVYLDKPRTRNPSAVYYKRNDRMIVLIKLRYLIHCCLSCCGRLDDYLTVWLKRCIDACRLSVHGHHCALSGLASYKPSHTVYRKVYRGAALWKQLIVWKSGLKRCIDYCKPVIVIELYSLTVESDHDKIISLVIIIQAYANRSDKKRILLNILLLKYYLAKHFLAS